MKEAAARTVDCNPITDTGNIEQINLSAVRVTSTLTLTEMVKHVEKKKKSCCNECVESNTTVES